jgi:hypothetical protein
MLLVLARYVSVVLLVRTVQSVERNDITGAQDDVMNFPGRAGQYILDSVPYTQARKGLTLEKWTVCPYDVIPHESPGSIFYGVASPMSPSSEIISRHGPPGQPSDHASVVSWMHL